jgi:hypothetical protein
VRKGHRAGQPTGQLANMRFDRDAAALLALPPASWEMFAAAQPSELVAITDCFAAMLPHVVADATPELADVTQRLIVELGQARYIDLMATTCAYFFVAAFGLIEVGEPR